MRSTGDVHGLRKLYDHVQNHVRGLRALGVSSESYASMMVDILFTSLPQDMVVEYHRLARYTSTDEQESTSGSESEADEELAKTTYLRGLIDGGSQRTFVRDDVAKRLKLKVVGEASLQLITFANDTTARRPVVKVKIVQLVLHSQYNSEAYIIEALTIPSICEVTCPNIPGESGISVLIGCDHMWRLLSGEVCRSKDNDKLVAISTVFGWTFQGPTTLSAHLGIDRTTAACVLRVGVTEKPPPDYLKRFWELESVGIVDDEKNNTLIDSSAMEEFQENITFADGRYQVALPWKAGMATLPDNLEVAKCRLQSLVRRLRRDGSVRQYDDAIRAYTKNDHAERATVDARDSDCTCYYRPHRAVIRDSSTSTRLRVVFDASSHGHAATSSSDHLEKGPKLNSDLIPILLHFRMYKIAITADIQKAFLQISIRPSDRDALRFLWFSSPPFPGAPLPALEHWRMTRVPFRTSASPSLLAATLQHNLQNTKGPDEDIAITLAISVYVDDLHMGADTLEKARRITAGAQAIMQRAGMKLSKWSSSAMELQSVFEEPNTDNCNVNKRLGDTEDRKVLGIVWDRTGDNFRFSAEHLLDTMTAATPTKRSVLQTCGKIFDPLGFLAPYRIRANILFQRIWERGLDWGGHRAPR
ncbi:uncharacterized protein LOC135384262 [Ornithodoros turicata]|uniref:uncharacterized protein LOC135384262 n=1 Tax=Ornithodoros turicata TaxID=34597 RepID=UPI003138A4B8